MENHSQFKEGINTYKDIEFELYRKKIKNFIIKINSKDKIVVSIPIKASQEFLIKFLDENLLKFKAHLEEKQLKQSINEKESWFFLFGQKIFFENDLDNHKIIINNKKYSSLNKKKVDIINNYRKKELKVYLLIKQLQLQKIMDIEDHLIKVRDKSTAWATNHVMKKIIYYSTNLSSFSKEIIDYVIVHELAHNKYANHSKNFWSFVEKYEPNYKIKRYKLKKIIYS